MIQIQFNVPSRGVKFGMNFQKYLLIGWNLNVQTSDSNPTYYHAYSLTSQVNWEFSLTAGKANRQFLLE